MSAGLFRTVVGSGPPLIVQGPAWGPSSDYLGAGLAPLVEGHTVVTFDPRNVGRSRRVDEPDAQAVDGLVDDLEALRVELGIERFVLLGHSHGGFVAMAYAVRHPAALRGLVVLNGALRRPVVDREVEDILERLGSRPERRDAIELFRRTNGRPPAATVDDRELARYLRRLMPAYFYDLEAMRRFMELARDAPPPSAAALQRMPKDMEQWVKEGLSGVLVPTLVATGRYDVATPPSRAREIGALLPAARTLVFEHSGHHPWVEEPQLFHAALDRFLTDSNLA